jgi:hypothetical protein
MRGVSGAVATAAVVVVAASTLLGGAAMADGRGSGHDGGNGNNGNNSNNGNNIRFDQSLVGLPAHQMIAIEGVPAAGAPWMVDGGSEATIKSHSRLDVRVRGLLITGTGTAADGTTGPVKQVVATLACANGDTATTAAVPLSAQGNARIRDHIKIPADCLAPVVLVRISGIAAADPWIAATGL